MWKHGQDEMKDDDKSLGELPTMGVDGKVVGGRAAAGGWEGRESMHSVGSAVTMGRPGEGIVDDGRTDGGRRWRAGEEILGRYVVERELGQGGMGVVYECLDKVAGVKVAVKCLPPELSHNSVEMEEVRENFELVVGLRHPNIAGVRTLEQDAGGEYFLVMDVAEGEPLRRWMRRRGGVGGGRNDEPTNRRGTGGGGRGGGTGRGMTLGEALPVLRQVAEALDYAHEEKIIHRDVKPGNVMIDGRGRVKVLDFGLAAQIRTSLSRASQAYRGTSGTGPYMAPEQWEGQPQDEKTDQYALGVMAYEMLAGRLPFENSELAVLKDAVLHGTVRDIPGVGKGAMGALRRALAKEAEARWESCGAFVEGLAGGGGGRGGGRRSARGRTLMGWLAVLGMGAVAAGIWWGGWGRENAGGTAARKEVTRPEAASPIAGETPAPPVEPEAPEVPEVPEAPENPLALPPEGAARSELEDALARLTARREALVQEGYAASEPERAPVEGVIATLESRIEKALEAEAEKAREAEREGRRAAAQRIADLEALSDLKKAVDQRVSLLDDKWQDGAFAKKRKTIADAWKKLEACTDAASLGKAKELRGDIYDAVDWIERNTPARNGLVDVEKALETLAGECAAADAGTLAAGTLHKADRAREDGVKQRDAGRYEDAASEYATAKGFYETALQEARSAKATAFVEEARIFAGSKMWDSCLEAVGNALAWDSDQAEARQLKAAAEEGKRAEKVEQGLEAARGAKGRGDWEACLAAAEGVLALEGGNRTAAGLKAEAEKNLKPSIVLKATLNGREVGAKVKARMPAGVTVEWSTPVTVTNLTGGRSYAFAAEYEAGGKKYAGETTVTAKERGVTEGVVVLEEVKARTIDLGGGVTMEMVWCPAGHFTMGSLNGDDVERPEHEVRLTKGFWMAKTEVTQEQWKRVMGSGNNPSRHKGDDLPVERVTWDECQEFCRKAGHGLQLPTEAEWEYACRAGSTGDYAGDVDQMAWYGEGYSGNTHPVGKKKPNEWGLYDMHGNVGEWCEDWYDSGYYAKSPGVDPKGSDSGDSRVLRGGTCCADAHFCRSAFRFGLEPGLRLWDLGFRPVARQD